MISDIIKAVRIHSGFMRFMSRLSIAHAEKLLGAPLADVVVVHVPLVATLATHVAVLKEPRIIQRLSLSSFHFLRSGDSIPGMELPPAQARLMRPMPFHHCDFQ